MQKFAGNTTKFQFWTAQDCNKDALQRLLNKKNATKKSTVKKPQTEKRLNKPVSPATTAARGAARTASGVVSSIIPVHHNQESAQPIQQIPKPQMKFTDADMDVSEKDDAKEMGETSEQATEEKQESEQEGQKQEDAEEEKSEGDAPYKQTFVEQE